MRWFVEVSSISPGASSRRLTVGAATWQGALAQARTAAKDTAPLSNFTIEVLPDGYRATNALARVRYVVSRAPDDAPLVDALVESPAPAASDDRDSAPASSPAAMAASALSRPRAAKATMMMGSSAPGATPASTTPADAPKPAAPASPGAAAAPRPAAAASAPRPAAAAPAAAAASPASAPRATPALSANIATAGETPVGRQSNPPADRGKILFRKSEDPGARSPLTYRELAIAVVAGTPADVALAVARANLDDVRGELDRANAPAGRLVQLAVFDHEWSGRPQRAPIVALTWKDWRGAEPEVKYANGSKGSSSTPAATPPKGASPSNRPPPMDVKGLASEISSAVEAARPAKPAIAAPDVPAAVEAIVSAKPAPAPAPAPAPVVAAAPAAAAAPAPKRKARPDDLMSEMFEAMHDVHFMQNALEGADFVLELLREKIPTRVALVHFYDINSKEFVVVKARAPQGAVLSTRSKEGTGLVGAALKTGKPLVVADAANDTRWTRERYSQAGHASPGQIVVVPMKSGARYLGALEIADHDDGGPLGEAEVHALAYVADQFAEFVNERGVLLSTGDSTGSFQVIEPSAASPKSRR